MQNGLPGADLIEAGVIDLREGRETVARSEEHTSELQSQSNLVCRLLLEKKKTRNATTRGAQAAQRADPPHSALGFRVGLVPVSAEFEGSVADQRRLDPAHSVSQYGSDSA